jgi:O-methyltransferase involved in polyketide biosynthesis
MNSVNKTLYIPLYGKAYVSKKNIILQDKKAEEIWEQEGFGLKGKSKSKWLAYYMAMRSAIYDEWVAKELEINPEAVVLHIGCGLDSRAERVNAKKKQWFDIDFRGYSTSQTAVILYKLIYHP